VLLPLLDTVDQVARAVMPANAYLYRQLFGFVQTAQIYTAADLRTRTRWLTGPSTPAVTLYFASM